MLQGCPLLLLIIITINFNLPIGIHKTDEGKKCEKLRTYYWLILILGHSLTPDNIRKCRAHLFVIYANDRSCHSSRMHPHTQAEFSLKEVMMRLPDYSTLFFMMQNSVSPQNSLRVHQLSCAGQGWASTPGKPLKDIIMTYPKIDRGSSLVLQPQHVY